ncbi:MAG: hypothetical protein IPL28_01145 [Chloroflexi bacterium]|nr:hypothetical protein [Chloroflexota bacterium]
MSKRKPQPPPKTFSVRPKRSLRHTLPFGLLLILILAAFSFTSYESYASLYDADYVGVEVCADCHTIMYDRWKDSPHANMTHQPSPETVVGDFNDSSWMLPPEGQLLPYDDELPAMRTFTEGADFYMALRRPGTADFTSFKIAYVIGYQYRQTYLTLEEGGSLAPPPPAMVYRTARVLPLLEPPREQHPHSRRFVGANDHPQFGVEPVLCPVPHHQLRHSGP